MSDFVHEFRLPDIDGPRERGQFAAALDALAKSELPAALAKHVLGGRNLVLEWFRSANFPDLSDPHTQSKRIAWEAMFDKVRDTDTKKAMQSMWDTLTAISQFAAPAKVDQPSNHDQVLQLLWSAISRWSAMWNLPNDSVCSLATLKPGSDKTRPPAFANSPKLFDTFQSLATSGDRDRPGFGWGHPALLMLGELFRWILADRDKEPDFPRDGEPVSTYVLLADKTESNPRGVIAKLTIERVPSGNGSVYPDPRYHSLLRTDAHWFPAIQTACEAVRRACPNNHVLNEFDFRWRLELRSDHALDWFSPLNGNSATAAFAIALRAAVMKEPIDEHCAVSATLKLGEQFGDSNHLQYTPTELGSVGSLSHKVLGPFRLLHVFELFVATSQKDDGRPEILPDNFQTPDVATFDQLFERMTTFGRMTRDYREAIKQRAAEILERQCSLKWKDSEGQARQMGGYVDPRLKWSFHAQRHEEASGKKDQEVALDKSKCEHELSEQAVRMVLQGSLPDLRFSAETEDKVSSSPDHPGQRYRRAWIYADSGFGKSLLLVRAEQRIADSPDLVPIRIGGPGLVVARLDSLSMFNQLLSKIGDPFLALATELHQGQGFFPLSPQPTDFTEEKNKQAKKAHLTTIAEWLQRLLRAGRLVLLLDALDQTEDNKAVIEVRNLVNTAVVAGNNVLLTGREESQATRPLMLNGEGAGKSQNGVEMTWLTLELEPFNEQQQNLVLEDFAEQVRKKAPAELLKVPLLLLMLRKLAAEGKLQPIRNRAELFKTVVADLIKQGRTSQEGLPKDQQFAYEEVVIRKLRELAAAQIQECGTPNIQDLSATTFDAVRAYLSKELWWGNEKDAQSVFETLAQVDLTTLGSLLEGFGKPGRTGLSWRMRSFLEYFTALAITDPKLETDKREWIDDLIAQHAPQTTSV